MIKTSREHNQPNAIKRITAMNLRSNDPLSNFHIDTKQRGKYVNPQVNGRYVPLQSDTA